MLTLLKNIVLFCGVIFLTLTSVFSQESEAQLTEKINGLFKEEKYAEAKPFAERLITLNPRSYDAQYKFGACLLYSGYKKQDAFKYLKYAVTDPTISPDAYFFLAKAFHLTYQFKDAITNYELYKSKAGTKINPNFQVDRQIEMCRNATKLLSTITEIVVVEKKEIEIANFFRLYNLKDIGGVILVAADFQSKIDKKKGYTPIIHFPAGAKVIYYASYGDSDKGQKDIYYRNKLPNGEWGMPLLAGGSINTPYDEDFPYLHPDGKYLYFSSKGHNSMGGYDVYRAELDPNTNSFGVPENIDFAISSPDDDMFYVVDSLDQNAYFASSRQSNNGKLFVYKVNVKRYPLQLAVIKGNFSSTIHPENKNIQILVSNAQTGEKVGTFNSNEKGDYLITLPKSGKYTYEMKVKGSEETHKSTFTVPYFKEFRPLKQQLQEELVATAEQVKIINLFDQTVENPEEILAELILRKSELNVNVDQFQNTEVQGNAGSLAVLGIDSENPQDIVVGMENIQNIQKENKEGVERLVNGANALAITNAQEAEKLQNEAKALVARTNNVSSNQEKYALLKQADEKLEKAVELKTEAAGLIRFADSLQPTLIKETEIFNEVKTITDQVKSLVADQKVGEADALVQPKINQLKEIQKDDKKDVLEQVLAEKKSITNEGNKLEQQHSSALAAEVPLKKELEDLKQQLSDAKAKDKPAIESKIAFKEQELSEAVAYTKQLEAKMEVNAKQEDKIDRKLNALQNIAAENKTTVSNEQAKSALTNADNQNSRSLKSYVDQQLTALEKDPELQNNSAIASIENEKQLSLQTTEIDQLISKNSNEEKAIESADLTPIEKANLKLKNDQLAVNKIDQALQFIDQAQLKDPNAFAKEETKLKEQRSDLINHQNEQRTELVKLSDNSKFEPVNETVGKIDPSYEAKKNAVKETDPVQQLNELNKVDEALVQALNKEIAQLSAQPSSPENEQRLLNVIHAKSKTQENIANREKSIQSLSPTVVEVTEDQVLSSLIPNVKDRQAAINKKDPKDQLAETIQLNNEIINAAKLEKQILENQLKSNPNDQKAEQKLTIVEQIIESKTQEKVTAEQQLAASNMVVKVPTKSEVVDKVAPNYAVELSAIQSLPTDEKAEKRLALEEKTLNALLAERKEIEESGSPSTDQKLAVIDEVIKDKESVIAEQKKILNIEAPETVSEQEVIADLLPNYENKKNELTAKDKSIERLTAENQLDQQLIDAVTEEMTQIRSVATPTANQQDKLAVLEKLLTEKKNELTARELELNQLKGIAASNSNQINNQTDLTELKTTVRPSYQANIEKITTNNQLSEQQKTTAIVAEDQALLDAISKELEKSTALINKGNADSVVLKRNDQLKELQAIQEAKLEEEKANAIASMSVKPDVMVQTVLPTYVLPSEEELSNPTNKQRLVDQEKALQAALVKEQVANKKILNKGFDSKIAAENNAIEEALEASDKRMETLKIVTDVPSNITTDPKLVVNRLDTSVQKTLNNQPENSSEATTALTALSDLKVKLEQEKKSLEKKKAPTSEIETKQQEIEWVENQTQKLQTYLDNQKQTIVSNNTENVFNRLTPEQQKTLNAPPNMNDAKGNVEALNELEKNLLSELKELKKSNSSEQDIQNKQAEINVVQAKKKEVQAWIDNQASDTNDQASAKQNDLNTLQTQEKVLMSQLENATPAEQKKIEKELAKNQREQQEIVQQQEQKIIADEVKITNDKLATLQENDAFKQVAEQQLKQENPTTQQVQRTQQTVAAVLEIKEMEKIVQSSGVVPISAEKAISLRRTISIEIGELEAERTILKQQNAKPERQLELSNYISELQKQLKVLDAIDADLNKESPLKAFQTIASQQEVSAEKEQLIRSDKTYKGIYEEYSEVLQLQGEWNNLTKKENELRQLYEKNGSSEAIVNQLKQLETEKESLEVDLKRAIESLSNSIQRSGLNKEEVQNVLWRDQLPIVVQPKMETTIVAEGFQINPTANVIKSARELPVGVKAPSGLVYRVQVGAFAKPVPEELFKEFTPVSGEQLQNGITRYMAGYFGNRGKVIQAQNQIRNLGYKDAFVVAYCDGVRISMAEAKRLEEQGLCVAKNQDSMVMEVVQNTLAQLPDSLKSTKIEAPAIDAYNKAPDAVPAEAVELRKGLFYTVQVGVYNRPATKEQMKNIQPLVTKRLPNGQLRYSSGIFHNIPDAKPKKAEAIALGITDAFITAYYNGERISLEEAKRLLDENGPSILTNLEPTVVDTAYVTEIVKQAIVSEQQNLNKKGVHQLVSTERFEVIPQHTLEQLSTKGQFYYDIETKQIKSNEINLNKELPNVGDLLTMDTLTVGEVEEKIAQEQGGWIINQSNNIKGDVANVLLQNNIPFSINAGKEETQIVVLRKNSRNFEEVLNQLSLIGVSVTTYNQFKDEK